jgi:hypothetical protein
VRRTSSDLVTRPHLRTTGRRFVQYFLERTGWRRIKLARIGLTGGEAQTCCNSKHWEDRSHGFPLSILADLGSPTYNIHQAPKEAKRT